MMRYLLPDFIGVATLGIWEIWVALAKIPHFVLPAPSAIFVAFWKMPTRCSARFA